MFPRRLILLALVLTCLALVLMAHGCATGGPDGSEGWESWPRWYALAPVYKRVSAAELAARCARYPGYRANACAARDYSTGLCWILSTDEEEQLPQWLKEHEEKHCAGYDHAAPPMIVPINPWGMR